MFRAPGQGNPRGYSLDDAVHLIWLVAAGPHENC